jgi:hypothetical protein
VPADSNPPDLLAANAIAIPANDVSYHIRYSLSIHFSLHFCDSIHFSLQVSDKLANYIRYHFDVSVQFCDNLSNRNYHHFSDNLTNRKRVHFCDNYANRNHFSDNHTNRNHLPDSESVHFSDHLPITDAIGLRSAVPIAHPSDLYYSHTATVLSDADSEMHLHPQTS